MKLSLNAFLFDLTLCTHARAIKRNKYYLGNIFAILIIVKSLHIGYLKKDRFNK